MSNQALSVSNTPKTTADLVIAKVKQFQQSGEVHFPANYSPENALKSAWLIIQETQDRNSKPALSVCTKESVANALLSMVIQGLNPTKKQGYFIVYGDKLQFQRSYFGTMAVCKQVTGAKEIFAEVVYDSDEFEYEIKRGRKIVTKHVQKLDNINRKKVIAAYCTIVTAEDKEFSDIMTFDEIQQAWKKSKTGAMKDGVLNTTSTHGEYTAEMAKKTVTNRACKAYINSSDDSNLMIVRQFNQEANEIRDAEVREEIESNANTIPLMIDTVDYDTGEIIENESPTTTESHQVNSSIPDAGF